MTSCLFKWAYKVIKGRPLQLDDAIDFNYLFELAVSNLFALLRGYLRLRKKVLLGRGVILRGKSCIHLSHGISIADNVLLDGVGKNGLAIGERSSIGRYGFIKVSGTLSSLGAGIAIGKDVGIGEFCHIGGAGGVSIGDDTIIGAYFSAHPENHVFDNPQLPIRLQGVTRKGISVGSGCWLGAKVTLLDGSRIGDQCVVAAGAVVTGEFPSRCIIGGVPARLIRKLDD